ncbi:MAG: Maf family nucleotide pyrophosphatase [Pseudomonadota bacterium]
MPIPLILGSQSPVRKQLLANAGINIVATLSPDIDETPLKSEAPRDVATRLCQQKADAILLPQEYHQGECLLLTGDTVVAAGRRIIDKALTDKDVANAIELMSGRRIRIYSAICLIMFNNGHHVKQWQHTNCSIVTFKRLSQQEKELYIKSGEGIGKGGGLMAEGMASKYVKNINGCYSTILGLPVYHLHQLLTGIGYYD